LLEISVVKVRNELESEMFSIAINRFTENIEYSQRYLPAGQ